MASLNFGALRLHQFSPVYCSLFFLLCMPLLFFFFFFFNDTATTEIYTLSLHDALPILETAARQIQDPKQRRIALRAASYFYNARATTAAILPEDLLAGEEPAEKTVRRSEEHTSELQSQSNLVCRLLLEKKNTARDRPSAVRTPYGPRVHRRDRAHDRGAAADLRAAGSGRRGDRDPARGADAVADLAHGD